MSARTGTILCAALLLAATACDGPAPRIDLSGMEPPVRELIEQRRQAVSTSEDALSWGELGDALLAHGLNTQAESCYARAVELSEEPFEWLYLQALASEPDAAGELFWHAATLRPNDALVELRIALSLQSRGMHADAVAAFARVRDLDPAIQRAHRGLGQTALAMGRAEEAVTSLERAVELLQTDAAGWSALAQAYGAVGRVEEAQRAALLAGRGREHRGFRDPIWERHVQESGVSSSMRYQRALRALAGNDTEAARMHVEAILSVRPDDADAQYLMGLIEGLGGDTVEARRRFELAIEADPEHGRSLLELAAMAEKDGRLEEALEWNTRAHELTPHDPSVVLALGRVQHGLGNVDGVLAALEELVALQPGQVTYLLDLGDLYMHQGRWDEAEERIRDAVRLAPEMAEAHYLLGQILERTSREELAVDAYRRAVELDPNSPALSKLESPSEG